MLIIHGLFTYQLIRPKKILKFRVILSQKLGSGIGKKIYFSKYFHKYQVSECSMKGDL